MLATAGAGIFLAFSNSTDASPQRHGEFDQETSLSARSNTSASPLWASNMTQTATAVAASPGAVPFPSTQAAAMALGPLSPPWIEAVPPWNPDDLPPWNVTAPPPWDAALSSAPGASPPPGGSPYPYSAGVVAPSPGGAVPITVPAGTIGPVPTSLNRPRHSSPTPGRAASPGRSPAPPRERSATPDRAQESPTPRASPQAPPPRRPSQHADTSPPARGRGLPNPCATMNDFRRQPCDQVLADLTR